MQNNQQTGYQAKMQDLPSLHVGNLSDKIFDSELFGFFQRAGFRPHKAKVAIDSMTKKHKGFGFVAFHKVEDAEKAKEALNNQKLDNRQIRISWKVNKKELLND